MFFVSFKFLLFVIITVTLYYLCPIKYRWVILMLASCFFNIYIAKQSIVIAIFSIFITYIASVFLNNKEKNVEKFSLISSIILLLTILIIFKHTPIVDNVNGLIVPLGISYYTLSLIGYLVDVYYKKQEPEKNFLKLILYTLYFPRIVQGPITSFKVFGPKVVKGNKLNYDNICSGVQRIIYGYFKKLVISQRVLLLTNNIFDGNITDYSAGGAVLLISTYLSFFSFYCDFSGYMDIVVGISQMFGVELDENFRQPLFSKNISEFWQRWHITLGAWFKDYVYIQLLVNPWVVNIASTLNNRFSKKIAKSILSIIPLLTVWLLTGIWHGFNIDYILWGVYFGLIGIVSHTFDAQLKNIPRLLRINTKKRWYKFFQICRTIIISTFGYVLSTLVGSKQIYQYLLILVNNFQIKMLKPSAFKSLGLDYTNLTILVMSIGVVLIVDLLTHKDNNIHITKLNPVIRWVVYALIIVVVVIFGLYGPGYDVKDFEYMRF